MAFCKYRAAKNQAVVCINDDVLLPRLTRTTHIEGLLQNAKIWMKYFESIASGVDFSLSGENELTHRVHCLWR